MLELAHKPRRGERLEVAIDRLDHDGRGAATLRAAIGPQATHRRYRVLVRKAVPGDRVGIVVERCRRGVIEARVAEMLEPSPERIEPRCVHFGQREQPGKGCGGCTLQRGQHPELRRQLSQSRQSRPGRRRRRWGGRCL